MMEPSRFRSHTDICFHHAVSLVIIWRGKPCRNRQYKNISAFFPFGSEDKVRIRRDTLFNQTADCFSVRLCVGKPHYISVISDKMMDSDYYILTLAAIARELNIRSLTSACIHLAAGLPLTWVSEQKDSFQAYLLQNESADFTFRGVDYHVDFAGADIFPQSFSAVADKLREFKGINMLCDIGNGTMNIMYINECRPLAKKCFTEKYGTHQCVLAVRENLMKQFGVSVDETILERVIRHGTADISQRYLTAICDTAVEYADGIFRRLREHEYDPELMRLYVVGGGSCILKNFGSYDKDRVIINDDICATAKGYELLAGQKRNRKGGIV